MIFNRRFLKNVRTAKNLTQSDLGELVGVSGVTIMRYETGQRTPNSDIFNKLCAVLGVPPVSLATGMSQAEWDALDPDISSALEESINFDLFRNIGASDNYSENQGTKQKYTRWRGLLDWNNEASWEEWLLNTYQQNLNFDGKKKTVEYVALLSENPKYQRTTPDTPTESENSPSEPFSAEGNTNTPPAKEKPSAGESDPTNGK